MTSSNVATRGHPMLPASEQDVVEFSAKMAPQVLCIIDAEEEFDWSQPFSSRNDSVKAMRSQSKAQEIFAKFNLVPTYAVDYPVAVQEDGYLPLREFVQDGKCEVGAQLHPWVTPPVEETVSEINSFTANLPEELQRRKIANLTSMIVANLGTAPKLFRTGRYGAGRKTVGLLQEFGYEIDCSVLPGPPITPHSPDYSNATPAPYWLGSEPRILEIPVTAGTVGPLRRYSSAADFAFRSTVSQSLKVPAILAGFGLLNRVRLSPEGNTLEEAKALTRTLLREGQRIFAMSYHSPSLVPGKTPYTRSARDVEQFLAWIEGFLEFFVGEIGGVPSTPTKVRTLALAEQSVAGQNLAGTGS